MVDDKSVSRNEITDSFGDYANIKVPESDTKSFFGMFLVYTGVLVCIAVI